MSIYLHIKTDDRVSALKPLLEQIEGFNLIGEIDSINYGEGFDFNYKNLKIRLFDDERTEDVICHPDFQSDAESYERVFNKIVIENQGLTSLVIEILELDDNIEFQREAINLISNKMHSNNYLISKVR